MGIKQRILLFATSHEPNIESFTMNMFGTRDFFTTDHKLTVDHVFKLAATYPNLNMNWIFTGKGTMTYFPANEDSGYSEKDFLTPQEILIEALEAELKKKQAIIDELKARL